VTYRMKDFFKKYFTFNKRERNGLFVLLSLLFLVIAAIQLLPLFIKRPKVDLTLLNAEIKNTNNTATEIDSNNKEIVDEDSFTEENQVNIVKSFDPNSATESELKQIGLPKRLINTIIKYRGKGGKFKSKSDLKKIYGMNDSMYNLIEKNILIENDTAYSSDKKTISKFNAQQKVEINSADSLSFVMMKGIGPAFAHRIIAFRKKLGGFYSVNQMKEVYGIDSIRFNSIVGNLIVDNSLITQINVNTSSILEFKKHPYINHNLANLIVAYRTTHGNYKTVEEIKKLNLITDELYRKLVPYLSVE